MEHKKIRKYAMNGLGIAILTGVLTCVYFDENKVKDKIIGGRDEGVYNKTQNKTNKVIRLEEINIPSEYREQLYHPKKRGSEPTNNVNGIERKIAEEIMLVTANKVNSAINFMRDEKGSILDISTSKIRYLVNKDEGKISGSMLVDAGDWGRMISFVGNNLEIYQDDRFAIERFQPGSSFNDEGFDRMSMIETLRREPNYVTCESAAELVNEAILKLGASPLKLSKLVRTIDQERINPDPNGKIPLFSVIYSIPGHSTINYAIRGKVFGGVPPKGIITYLEFNLNEFVLPLDTLRGN